MKRQRRQKSIELYSFDAFCSPKIFLTDGNMSDYSIRQIQGGISMSEYGEECKRKPIGLYDPRFEHDNCGIGAIVNIKGKKTQEKFFNKQ